MWKFMEFKILVHCLTLLTLASNTQGAKILSVFGFPGPSQYIMASALLKGLAEKGHEVTSISTFPQKTPVKNFRDIAVMENSKLFDAFTTGAVGEERKDVSFFEEMSEFSDLGAKMVENVLENPEVKKMMKREKFDLIIVETIFCDALYGLGQHFNAPMVGVSTFGTINFIDVLVNNISPMSYIPHIALPYENHMNLKERIINAIYNIYDDFHMNYVRLPLQEKLFYKYFPNSRQTFEEVRRNFSLILLNQHFTLSYPRPYVSNMIEVGGLHIKQKPDPLPQDLQMFLDNATEGAIYFSMGSNLKSKNIPSETLKVFLDTFRELKLKVLWKFEAETLPNKPDNVFIKAWYPQPSVLAHPNVKLFISHGGFLSTTETIFHGKPILGIPVFGDQHMNVNNAVKGGYALSVKLNEITNNEFKSKIMELLTNDRYTKRVQQLSRRYRDQPQTPLEKAIYWIEYVLRHEGAEHLRNAGVDLNYFQQSNLDVFAILGGGLLLILVILFVILRLLVKLLCGAKNSKKNSKKQKVKRNCHCALATKLHSVHNNYSPGAHYKCKMKSIKYSQLIFSCLILFFLLGEINAAKILSIFGYPGPSQYIMGLALLKGLAERGHEVTSISTFPQKTPIKNFRDVPVMENSKLFEPVMTYAVSQDNRKSFFDELFEYAEIGLEMSVNVLENPKFKEIMKSEKFDLIIVEAFNSEVLYGLGEHFNAPMVGVSTFGTINFVDILVNNISPMSYIPHMSLPYDNHMSLKERVINTVTNLIDDYCYRKLMLPKQEALYNKYFPNAKLSFHEAQTSFPLTLLNQHFTLSYPRPYVTNMIEVGGLHVKQKPDPLPQDLQTLMDNATEGAIYFSMGSNLKSKNISPETLKMFMDSFRELKVKVFWKFEDEALPNKPDNVVIRKWYPQPSVLAHPNIKLFISHGGFLSTTETIFHAKPILGIPILGDQPMNIMNAVRGGYALSLNFKEITKETFKSKILELLTNDSYTKRVQQLSRRYRDQPMTPLETAIYWIEYVLRHEGAPHIRNAGVDLNYLQQNNVDVFAILAGGLLCVITLIVLAIRFLLKLLKDDKQDKKLKEN
ncbi:uncharacterized protein ACRADG_013090 [Cochliomyia hominivorax]